MKERRPSIPRGDGSLAGAFAANNFVTLPAWFTVRQARAVLHLKRRSYALILDEPGGTRAVGGAVLAAATGDQALASCATPLGPALPARLSIEEALRQLHAHTSALVPVVVDGLVVSILSRAELSGARQPSFERRSAERLAA